MKNNELNTWLDRLHKGAFASAASARKSASKTTGLTDKAKAKAFEAIDLYFGSTPTDSPAPAPAASAPPALEAMAAKVPSMGIHEIAMLADIRSKFEGDYANSSIIKQLDEIIEAKLKSL